MVLWLCVVSVWWFIFGVMVGFMNILIINGGLFSMVLIVFIIDRLLMYVGMVVNVFVLVM